jgi:cyclic pyranopterin phosphate synthase
MKKRAKQLTHLDSSGEPAMVDVGAKAETRRAAHAVAIVELPPEVARLLTDGEIHSAKGPVFQTASLAGVMGAKRTAELIPLCHPLRIDDVNIEIEMRDTDAEVHCRVRATDRTGVEMEALTGASIAALTIYDMCKAVSHGIRIREVRLLEKTGGKSDFRAG